MLRSPPHVVRRCVSPPQPLQSSSRSAAEAAAAAATQSAVSPATAAVAYSADVAAAEWSRRPTPVLARLLEISAAFGGWYAKSLIHRDRQRAAADMREVGVCARELCGVQTTLHQCSGTHKHARRQTVCVCTCQRNHSSAGGC